MPGTDAPALGEGGRRGLAVDAAVVVALVALAVWTRAPALGPSSLWLDDAWIALVSRADSFGEMVRMSVTAPGFGATLAGLLSVFGLRTWAVQLPAFVAGVALPAATFVVLRRQAVAAHAAALGGVLLALSPVAVTYSGRVKPFAVDALVTLLLLWLGWRLLAGQGRRRTLVALAGLGVAGTVFSSAVAPAVVTTLLLVTAGAGVRRWWPAGRAGRGLDVRVTLAEAGTALGAYLVFAAGWYAGVLSPAVNPGLRSYWSEHFLQLWPPERAAGSAGRAADGLLSGVAALPPAVLAVALLVAIVTVAIRRPWLAALLLAPLGAAVVAAALELAPLGGGRTDLYLYSTVGLLLALALHELPRRGVGVAVAALAAVGLALPGLPRASYPAQDVAPLIARAEAEVGEDGRIVVYPATRWAYALYTTSPVTFEFNDRTANGFEPVLADDRVVVLDPQRVPEPDYRPQLEGRIDAAAELWLVASHWRDDLAALERDLADLGWEQVDRHDAAGAILGRWQRR